MVHCYSLPHPAIFCQKKHSMSNPTNTPPYSPLIHKTTPRMPDLDIADAPATHTALSSRGTTARLFVVFDGTDSRSRASSNINHTHTLATPPLAWQAHDPGRVMRSVVSAARRRLNYGAATSLVGAHDAHCLLLLFLLFWRLFFPAWRR